MPEKREYTVCFLFDSDLRNVLLVKKGRTEFKDRFNGVGGELGPDGNPNETPIECAIREIAEETGVQYDEFESLGLARQVRLGTLSLPYDCKYGENAECVLHYFAGAMKPETVPNAETDAGEALVMEPVADILAANVENTRYAGKGDVQYFVNAGLETLRRHLAGKE